MDIQKGTKGQDARAGKKTKGKECMMGGGSEGEKRELELGEILAS